LACNTATSAAVTELRRRYPDTIIIGIEPALKLAVQRHPDGKILVLATEATLREKKFAALMARYEQDCEICKCPCPELVAFVERGELEGPALEAVLQSRLGPFLTPNPQAIVLGCTHYPFLSKTISAVVGDETELLDGSEGTAKETARRLREASLLSDQTQGTIRFENSLPDEEMLRRAKSLYEGSFCRGGNLPPV
jgi:glutamate racemase